MTDFRKAIQSKFEETSRYANFGDVLMRIHIKGFRCHTNTVVDIESPITAFSGLNGTGKSTILQLAAAAYKTPDSNIQKSYCIRDFLVVGTLDPRPFTTNATVEFKFWQGDRSLKPLTLSRNDATKRWQGYSRRSKRLVFFAGIGLYIPQTEKRDFIFHNASRLKISGSSSIPNDIKNKTCKVLSQSYDDIVSNTVTYSKQTGKVISVQRSGTSYSEAHMGCGEARSQYLINMLETLPEKSLVLIEEPETSLHPSAQHEFGKYLVDVVNRKCHQILLTTHSEFILESLPSKSWVYLKKKIDGIDTIPGLTPLQAKSLMAEGHVKALHVLVEDDCAMAVLREILRKGDLDFLNSIGIYSIKAGADSIRKIVTFLSSTDLPVAAVLDADMNPSPGDNIFKLPGSQPPEKDLFASRVVKDHIQLNYGVNMEDFAARLIDVDHHYWFEQLANHISQDESALIIEVARVYAGSLLELDISTLIEQLREASH